MDMAVFKNQIAPNPEGAELEVPLNCMHNFLEKIKKGKCFIYENKQIACRSLALFQSPKYKFNKVGILIFPIFAKLDQLFHCLINLPLSFRSHSLANFSCSTFLFTIVFLRHQLSSLFAQYFPL